MEFTTDPDGKELLLKDGKHQVMMEWEKPYMEACIDALQPRGNVLEIGFGLGYSANQIQTYKPESHTIIEYHPLVAEKARAWAAHHSNVTIIEATWQDALSTLGTYDTIFFDDYPLDIDVSSAQKLSTENQQALADIEADVAQFKPKSYTDADLAFFFKHMPKTKDTSGAFCQKFFEGILKEGQITEGQFEWCKEQLTKQGIDLREPLQERGPSDRLIQFLEPALQNHLNQDGRFSCYLERTDSLRKHKAFKKLVLKNKRLIFTEKKIAVDVSKHCKYFEGHEAYVITIEKVT